MKCRNCGHDNPEYSEVCENCAVSLRSEPQRDDDTPSWGFVDENKDIRFSFGGRNAAQNTVRKAQPIMLPETKMQNKAGIIGTLAVKAANRNDMKQERR